MYVRTGHTAFNTISIENTGVAPLTFSGAEFSGGDASVFSLFDQLTQAVPRFPREIGVGGGSGSSRSGAPAARRSAGTARR